MPRLACLAALTALIVAAPALAQHQADAKALPSDDYVIVEATNVGRSAVSTHFKWPEAPLSNPGSLPAGSKDLQKSPSGHSAM